MDTYFRFAILRLVISVAHMRCIKLENPSKVLPDSIKNTDPGNVRQRKNNTHSSDDITNETSWNKLLICTASYLTHTHTHTHKYIN